MRYSDRVAIISILSIIIVIGLKSTGNTPIAITTMKIIENQTNEGFLWHTQCAYQKIKTNSKR